VTKRVKARYLIARRKTAAIPMDVLPKNELKQGQSYEGWKCRHCHGLLAAREVSSGAEAPSPVPVSQLFPIDCPHCMVRGHYNANSREVWEHNR
jgi:hypothetical protein